MPKAAQRSLVTPADARRFNSAITVRDQAAFLAELNAFLEEKLASARRTALNKDMLTNSMRNTALRLKAQTKWAPTEGDVQRGRVAMLAEYARPQNLPLVEFAHLADKSRQQIYKDIAAKRLLALNVGRRGQRLPDWQLDPVRLQLTQAVLAHAEAVDEWTIYQVLSEPMEALKGASPINAARRGNLKFVGVAVLDALDIHAPELDLGSA